MDCIGWFAWFSFFYFFGRPRFQKWQRMVHNTKCKNFKYVYDSICIFFFLKKKRVEMWLERLTYVDFCFKKVSNHFLFAQKYVIFWHSNTWINLAFGIDTTQKQKIIQLFLLSFFKQTMQTPGNFFFLLQKTKVIYIFYNIKNFPFHC